MKDRVVPEKQERFDVTFLPRNRCLIYDHKDDIVIHCTTTEAIGLAWSIRYAAGEKVDSYELPQPAKFDQLPLPGYDP